MKVGCCSRTASVRCENIRSARRCSTRTIHPRCWRVRVEPLLRPEPSEREGYVPNVVYTCGAMRHNDQIILPYAVSDTYSNFATIKIAALMQAMS